MSSYPPPGPPNGDPFEHQPQQPPSGPTYGGAGEPAYGAPQQQQPAPNKSRTVLIVGIVAAVLLIAILTVGGYLLFKKDDNGSDKGDTKTNHSSTPSNSGNSGNPNTGKGKTVSPDGAPYSYTVPSGFEQTTVPSSLNDIGGKYTTVVAPHSGAPQANLILVTEIDGLDSSNLDQTAASVSQRAQVTKQEKIKLDGKQALRLQFHNANSHSDGYYIYRSLGGEKTLYISGAWTTQKSAIEQGLGALTDSIKIK